MSEARPTIAIGFMLAAINILREISKKCHAGEPLDPSLSNWLAVRLDRFLDHQCNSIEDALGLRQPRGGVPWWLIEAMYERDAALRELAIEVAGEFSLSVRAREVRRLTTDPHVDIEPAWRPDGAGLYFVSARGGSFDILFYDPIH